MVKTKNTCVNCAELRCECRETCEDNELSDVVVVVDVEKAKRALVDRWF